MKKPAKNFLPYDQLSKDLKKKAMSQVKFLGYHPSKISGLYFDVQGDEIKGVMDKNLI